MQGGGHHSTPKHLGANPLEGDRGNAPHRAPLGPEEDWQHLGPRGRQEEEDDDC